MRKSWTAMSSVSRLGWNLLVLFKSQICNRSSPPSSLGAIGVGLYAEEEQRETVAFEPAPSVPDSTRGGCGDCLSPSSLEAVPSVKEATCEERSSSSSGSAGPSLGKSSSSSPPSLSPGLISTPHQAGQAGGWGAVQPGPAIHRATQF